jgi:hypothetical protein
MVMRNLKKVFKVYSPLPIVYTTSVLITIFETDIHESFSFKMMVQYLVLLRIDRVYKNRLE